MRKNKDLEIAITGIKISIIAIAINLFSINLSYSLEKMPRSIQNGIQVIILGLAIFLIYLITKIKQK
jgi:hypothetical protein